MLFPVGSALFSCSSNCLDCHEVDVAPSLSLEDKSPDFAFCPLEQHFQFHVCALSELLGDAARSLSCRKAETAGFRASLPHARALPANAFLIDSEYPTSHSAALSTAYF